jgi:hypothetical protein
MADCESTKEIKIHQPHAILVQILFLLLPNSTRRRSREKQPNVTHYLPFVWWFSIFNFFQNDGFLKTKIVFFFRLVFIFESNQLCFRSHVFEQDEFNIQIIILLAIE